MDRLSLLSVVPHNIKLVEQDSQHPGSYKSEDKDKAHRDDYRRCPLPIRHPLLKSEYKCKFQYHVVVYCNVTSMEQN